jgi:type VI secretion system protein ImpB
MATKKEGIQKTISRVRPPRVQITYEVQKGDAIENKELPFSLAVIGDFARPKDTDGKNPAKVKDRKFVGVDLENFDNVMQAMAPNASFRVKNALSAEGGEFGVNLQFNSLEDFTPEAVVQQVEPLRKLLELRTKFSDLRGKLVNEKLEDTLLEVLKNTEQLKQLGQEAGTDKE